MFSEAFMFSRKPEHCNFKVLLTSLIEVVLFYDPVRDLLVLLHLNDMLFKIDIQVDFTQNYLEHPC